MSVRLRRIVGVVLLVAGLALPAGAGVLEEATRLEEGRAMRWSTGVFDPESNYDSYHISAGEKMTFCELEGPGEVRHIWWTIMGDDRRFGRTLILRIYYDDSPVPSVETPIGDFFAMGNGMQTPIQTYPIEVTSFGRSLNSYWRMPFNRKFRLELEHQGHGSLGVYCQVDWMKKKKLPEDTLYFHARYYQEAAPPPRFTNYTIFDGKGEGQFVGVVLSSQNIMGSWFGEADDRYYIDGEEEPSLVGTGTEDYFTDAWNLRTFTNLNAGVSIKEFNGEDCRVTMYRWHLNNPIPFKKSLKVTVERRSFAGYYDEDNRWQGWDFKYRPDFWASVGFWYQRGIAEPWCTLAPVEQRINPEVFVETWDLASQDRITVSKGTRIRAGSNRVGHKKRGTFFYADEPGGWFDVPLTIGQAGRYSITVWQILHKTGGVYKVTLRPAGESPDAALELDPAMDFYDPFLALKENYPENTHYGTKNISKCGVHPLEPGDYTMRFQCVASNVNTMDYATGKQGYNLRIDGISLRKMPIDDLKAWMEDYLAEEEKLFAGYMAEAEKTVQTLAAAVEKYHLDHGKYPASLEALVKAGFATAPPRDPWGQLYQYAYPGEFNLSSFDVFSWHGNSRRPDAWIGNWKYPYKIEGAIEGESLRRKDRSGSDVGMVRHEYAVRSIPPTSNGSHLIVQLHRPSDWMELALPDVKAGAYRVKLCLVTSWNFGKLKWSLDGQPLGGEIDSFSHKVDRVVVDGGTVKLGPGPHTLKVESLGQAENASGSFAGLDALVLLPVE